MGYNKGLHSSSGGSQRGRPYVLILLITFGVALLGVMLLHKLRERRIYTLLLKEKDHQILALQLLLQKERDRSKELRGKNEEMKGKIYALRSQKMELARTVVEMQSTLDSLKEEQKLMESAFEEMQNEQRLMQEKGRNVGLRGSETVALRENLKHKEAEIEDLKRRLQIPVNEIVTANGTVAAEDESEKDESSGKSVKYEGDGNEDASKSKLTKFKDGGVATEIKDEIRTNGERRKTNEDPQDDGAEVVDGREKKAIKEEHAGQVENNADGGSQDFKVKQLAGVKRKHGHASRTKGKRRRIIVKNSLNGVLENHISNRKVVYKDDLKGRRVSDEGNFAREDEGRNNNSPRKDKPKAKLLKPEKHENKDGNGKKVNNTKHQVKNGGTKIYPEKQKLDEQSLVRQNWSKRHINKADKNEGQTKSKVLLERLEELEEVLDLQKQERDAIDSGHDDEDNDDDFSRESQPEFEDEKDEYKEEIDESELQPAQITLRITLFNMDNGFRTQRTTPMFAEIAWPIRSAQPINLSNIIF
ncbi:hypothetical protein CR513_58309, partial [Mucuna pruriens]